MDIIKIVKNNLDKKYDRSNWLHQVRIYSKVKDIEVKGKCVLINSPWGSGKTYRFKYNLQPIFENEGYRCVYISLFGIRAVDDLKIKLINNCLNHKYKIFLLPFIIIINCFLILRIHKVDLSITLKDRIIPKSFYPSHILLFIDILWLICQFMGLDFIKTILSGLSNKFLGTGIPMNKSEIGELFNPYCDIFVFDDLERISDDCKIKEIMGFIADLKYIHGFNILLIGDEEHLNRKKHLDEYNLYKEKLIDYEESEISITEDIFDEIVENIENKRVKQFVIDGLKPHIDFNGIGKNHITKI